MATYEVTCAGCGVLFTARSPRAKWHAPGCKKQAQRNPPAAEAPPPGASEHPIVAAVRKELVDAQKDESVDGQAALLLAAQAASASAANVASLIRQMREVLDAALGRKPGADAPPPADPAPVPVVDDEVTKARNARERKLAQARAAADRA